MDVKPKADADVKDNENMQPGVQDQNGNVIQFKIKQSTQLKKLMNSYCSRKGIAMDTLRFTMDGTRLQGHLTPKDYDMVEGDVLEVFMEQQGGDGVRSSMPSEFYCYSKF